MSALAAGLRTESGIGALRAVRFATLEASARTAVAPCATAPEREMNRAAGVLGLELVPSRIVLAAVW